MPLLQHPEMQREGLRSKSVSAVSGKLSQPLVDCFLFHKKCFVLFFLLFFFLLKNICVMASPKYHHGQEWVGATQDEGSFKPLPACAEGNQAPTIPPIMMLWLPICAVLNQVVATFPYGKVKSCQQWAPLTLSDQLHSNPLVRHHSQKCCREQALTDEKLSSTCWQQPPDKVISMANSPGHYLYTVHR